MDRYTSKQSQGANGQTDPLSFTGRITRAAARHPWRVLGLWVLLLVGAFGAAGTMNIASNTDTAGTEATEAADLIKERLREETPPEEFIVVESASSTSDDAAYAAFVDSLVADVKALGEVESVTSYRDGAEGLVSADGRTALVTVVLKGDEDDAADNAEPMVDVVKKVDGVDGFRVTTVGFGSVGNEITTLLNDTLAQGELIGIVVALIVLLVVFGAVFATGLPIMVAL
ncbi:MAG TPA: MMPL family transporter, partial [Dehalococcoidia bacterium]|nr:MMPL family transporter [Dehalococcoidia bacterium]